MGQDRSVYLLAFFVSFLAFVVYLPALRNGFVIWDDEWVVMNNLHIQTLTVASFKWALTDLSFSLWQPAAWISHVIDYAIWGLNPLGHHLSGIVLHAINAFLVVSVVVLLLEAWRTTLMRRGLSEGLDRRMILAAAGVTGVLFALHPLQVEPAVWISGRTDLICALFYLLSVIAYVRRVTGGAMGPAPGISGRFFLDRRYILSFVFFLLALMGKPSAVTLPLVLILLDWYPLGRFSLEKPSRIFSEKLPFIAIGIVVSLVTMRAHSSIGAMASLDDLSFFPRASLAVRALAAYLVKIALPVNLLPFYPFPEDMAFISSGTIAALALAAGVSTACIALVRRRPYLLAVWAYFLITMLPSLAGMGGRSSFMADRYVYLPGLGIFLLAGLGAAYLWHRVGFFEGRRAAKRLILIGAAGLLLTMMFLTLRQTAVWKDTISLWGHVIEKEPSRIPLAYNNRGLAYLGMGQFDRAIADCSAAIAIDPQYYLAYYNRGKALRALGRPKEAMDDFNRAIEINPRYADTYEARGGLFQEAGLLQPAIADLTAAITLDPGQRDAYIIRGIAHKEMGRFDLALEDYSRAIALDPRGVEAYNNRGVVFKYMGNLQAAISDFSRAVELNPSFHLAYVNRAVALGMAGRVEDAIEDYGRALLLTPDLPEAYLGRGDLYRGLGSHERAMEDYRVACDLGSEAGCRAFGTLRAGTAAAAR